MTGIDIALIVILIGFALLGLKHGSIWIAGCLLGGFMGAYLVETYRLPVANMMGDFTGAKIIAGIGLFAVGVVVTVIPSWIVSKLAGLFCLGAFDKILGVLVGLAAGSVAMLLSFMTLLPRVPALERSASWKNSRVARPACEYVENFLNHPSKEQSSVTEEIADNFADRMTPLVDKTTEALKSTANIVEKTVTKKAKAVGQAVVGEK